MFIIPTAYYIKQKTPFAHILTEKKPLFPQIIAGIILCLATVLLLFITFIFLSLLANTPYLELLRNYAPPRRNILYALFIIGFGEEWFFRGFVFDKLYKDTNSKLIAILLSSILFALVHFQFWLIGDHTWALIANMIFCFFVGLLYAFARCYTKSSTLTSVSLAHGLYWIVMPIITQHI